MIRSLLLKTVPIVGAVWLVAGIAAAQTAADGPPPFRPTLGDLMTAYVQPRHLKIGLAGQARNWDYLAYEVHELEETLEAIERQVPRYRDAAMGDLMKMIEAPLKSVESAIKARDAAAFDAAYARLTDGCNACHAATGHRMIVIQLPRSSPFPNQSFAPLKP